MGPFGNGPAEESYPNAVSYFRTDSPYDGTLALELSDMIDEINYHRAKKDDR